MLIANTQFKHKLAHRATWISEITKNRRNPVRNQIDYIITDISFRQKILDSRSYAGIFIETDHRLVIANFQLEETGKKNKIKYTQNKYIYDTEKLKDEETQNEFKFKLAEKLNELNRDLKSWGEMREIYHQVSKDVLGSKKGPTKSKNINITTLSDYQKKLKLEIQSEQNTDKRKELRSKRNKILKELHAVVQKEREEKELNKIEDIERAKNDSNKMFKAVREINKKKKKEKISIVENDKFLNDENSVTKISKFFENFFNDKDIKEDFSHIEPTKMKVPFTETEIKTAVKKLKNNKSPGPDNIVSEMLKNSPDIAYNKIAELFNYIAETGDVDEDLYSGILTPLQKPGKEKGKEENLRPIILLNVIRKILAIVLLSRISNKIDNKIPNTQTAYRAGRSTTENVLTFKLLEEKAITEVNYEINIRLLDMSKAFDNVNRKILMDDLKLILSNDELHLVKILLTNVSLQVKTNNIFGEKFKTTKGIPQGDSLSPILFTLYLANAMKEENNVNKKI